MYVLPAHKFVLSRVLHAGAGVLTNVQFRQQWFPEVNIVIHTASKTAA
jgi:hypothetical protein